ncbi:hypothetical protein PINS_up023738 [Pythium insidiosum]|nr:hypothetical protein PINS_up023738 [Pythium insidiosum]
MVYRLKRSSLLKKPLKNFNGKQDNSKPPRDKPAQAKPREKTIFDHSVLLCGTDGELSFEEVRARQFKVRVSAQTVSRGSNPFLLGDAATLEAIKPSQAKVAKMNSGKFTGQEQVVSKPAAALSALDTAASRRHDNQHSGCHGRCKRYVLQSTGGNKLRHRKRGILTKPSQ